MLPGGVLGEAVVGAAVDDDGLGGQLINERTGCAVRQGEEDHVVTGQRPGGGRLEDPIRQRQQVWVVGDERRPCTGVGRQCADLDVWVREQQPEELTSGVPAGACDRGRYLY